MRTRPICRLLAAKGCSMRLAKAIRMAASIRLTAFNFWSAIRARHSASVRPGGA